MIVGDAQAHAQEILETNSKIYDKDVDEEKKKKDNRDF